VLNFSWVEYLAKNMELKPILYVEKGGSMYRKITHWEAEDTLQGNGWWTTQCEGE
jgi:hypothetical protein